jgi:uncharacterized protein
MFEFIWKLPRRLGQAMIVVYQKTLSPDHSWVSRVIRIRVCRYRPTCSQYTYDAIKKYGLIKGSLMGAWRILRCNPWSHGGHDPVK